MAHTVSVSLFRPVTVKKDKQGNKYKVVSKVWWAAWRDARGKLFRVSTHLRDKVVAKQYASKLERELGMGRIGLGDKYSKHRERPLLEHLEDYEAHLEADDLNKDYIALTVQRATAVITGCNFELMADLSATKVQAYLSHLRKVGLTGEGPGLSISSSNGYQRAIKMVSRWLVSDGRMAEDPLAWLEAKNTDEDRRRTRRALSDEDFARLIVATTNGPVVNGMTGVDRAVLYTFAACTGFRRNESGSLVRSAFNFEGDSPSVMLAAKVAKNRKKSPPTPLPTAVAATIKAWIEHRGFGPTDVLFPVTEKKTGKMLRADLERADPPIPYQDERGDFYDYHALRVQYVTNLGAANVLLPLMQKLARHSNPTLTSNTYYRPPSSELGEAVNRLPVMPSVPMPPPKRPKSA